MSAGSVVDQAANAARFIQDRTHEAHFDELLWMIRQKRDHEALQVPEWEELRDLASAIKEHTLSNLVHYLEMFEASAKRNGAIVHWGWTRTSITRSFTTSCKAGTPTLWSNQSQC